MPVIYETFRYAFATHRGGGASLTRLRDNTSVFFQPGDDGAAVIHAVECMAACGARETFDVWASDYSDLLDSHAQHATNRK